jgi:hypothetical protein
LAARSAARFLGLWCVQGPRLWKVIDPSSVNLNSKREVSRHRGSWFAIKSLRIDRVGKLLRLYLKSIAEVRRKTRIKKDIATCSSITKGINLYSNPVLAEHICKGKGTACHS